MDNVTKIMRLLHASSFSDLHSEMTGSACVGGYSIYQNKTSIAYIAYVTKMQKKGMNDIENYDKWNKVEVKTRFFSIERERG